MLPLRAFSASRIMPCFKMGVDTGKLADPLSGGHHHALNQICRKDGGCKKGVHSDNRNWDFENLVQSTPQQPGVSTSENSLPLDKRLLQLEQIYPIVFIKSFVLDNTRASKSSIELLGSRRTTQNATSEFSRLPVLLPTTPLLTGILALEAKL